MNDYTIFFANHTTGVVIMRHIRRTSERRARAGFLRSMRYWEELCPGERYELRVLPGFLPLDSSLWVENPTIEVA